MKYIKNNSFFWIFSVISIILIVASWFVPPVSVIDSSVLAAVGELFGFAALGAVIKAIDKGVDAKLSKGDISIEIENDNHDKEGE